MGILRVLGLLWASSAFAITTPANQDIYSDSLTIERASAEAPGSLEASAGDVSSAELTAPIDDSNESLESVSEVVKASAKPKAKKSARK